MEIKDLQELKQLREMLQKNTPEELDKDADIKRMYFCMGSKQKIPAIKLRRKITKDDLREAKDWVENEMEILTADFPQGCACS